MHNFFEFSFGVLCGVICFICGMICGAKWATRRIFFHVRESGGDAVAKAFLNLILAVKPKNTENEKP